MNSGSSDPKPTTLTIKPTPGILIYLLNILSLWAWCGSVVKVVAWDPWGGGLGSLGSWVQAPLAAELASGGLTQPVILLKVSKMSTSILVIIPAGSKATEGLASGRASGRKNIAPRKGTMIGARKKLTLLRDKGFQMVWWWLYFVVKTDHTKRF